MIRIMITGCSMHSYDLIREMRNNTDSEEIYVVGINCEDTALLRAGVDAGYVVPKITEPNYLQTVLDICKKERVDVILPFITAELPIMAANRMFFENEGIRVSVSSLNSIEHAGNKVALAGMFSYCMPKQKLIRKDAERRANLVMDFAHEIGFPMKSFCCKLPNRCGGVGFSIIDNEKAMDITLYNKFGLNRYITLTTLLDLVAYCDEDIILQEYEEGSEYSVCLLADHGKVLYQLGFEASLTVFGSAMFAQIKDNDEAYKIASRIVSETGLDGNVCVDFILKPDGHVKLLEVNPRLSATLPFIAHAGLNLPYLRCKQLMGYDVKSKDVQKKINDGINRNLRMSKNYESEYFE